MDGHYHHNDPHTVFYYCFFFFFLHNFRDPTGDKEVRLTTQRKQLSGQSGIPSLLVKKECAGSRLQVDYLHAY